MYEAPGGRGRGIAFVPPVTEYYLPREERREERDRRLGQKPDQRVPPEKRRLVPPPPRGERKRPEAKPRPGGAMFTPRAYTLIQRISSLGMRLRTGLISFQLQAHRALVAARKSQRRNGRSI
jgi:hypothetical protein